MNLIYMVFGDNMLNHNQANFSILTFLGQKEHINKVIVVTDNPSFYNHLKDDKIVVETVSEKQLEEWKGKYNFFWRIKIKLIESIAVKRKGQSLLYLDSDTFLYGDLRTIKTTLENGEHIMHLNEGKLSRLGSKTEKLMWRQSRGKTFGGIVIDGNHSMWNAGVIGISGEHTEKSIHRTLAVCDDMCKAGVTSRLIEQFAFSAALEEERRLVSAKAVIGHYWGNKEGWNDLITGFFVTSHTHDLSFDEELSAIKKIDFTKIPVKIKIPGSRGRLIKFVTRMLPAKYSTFVSR